MNVVDRVRADRDRWRRRFYKVRDSRDYWRGVAQDLRLRLDDATRPALSDWPRSYLHEEDRIAARRRTWRDSKRRHRALSRNRT